MLQTLHISNVALMDEIEVNFQNGLNILSGETGAGKSIIIGSILSVISGQKMSKDSLRDINKPGLMELVFQVDEPEVMAALQSLEVETEEGQIILSRKLSPQKGVSSYRLNGETVVASKIQEVASLLLDVHGQHDHQLLLKHSKHLDFLDEYAHKQVDTLKKQVAEGYHFYQTITKNLSEMTLDEEQRLRELAFCEFEMREIEEAHLNEGEEEELALAYKKASYARQIQNALGKAYENLSDKTSDLLSQSIREMQGISSYDAEIDGFLSQLMDVDALLNDLNRDISNYLGNLEVDEAVLAELQARLDIIHDMKRKYGGSVTAVWQHYEKSKQKVAELQDYEERRQALLHQQKKMEQELERMSLQLSEIRKQAATSFETELTRILQELNFLTVDFRVVFERLPHFSVKGVDEVSFYISTNPGTPVRPLQQVASGGELSRIMLAIKSILAETEDVGTLVFDEIDTGISGRTAQRVAELLHKIGSHRQVICISHLPQIVSMADEHFLIEKDVVGEKDVMTQTDIRTLSIDESIREIARLLGGREITELVLQNAAEMKQIAKR